MCPNPRKELIWQCMVCLILFTWNANGFPLMPTLSSVTYSQKNRRCLLDNNQNYRPVIHPGGIFTPSNQLRSVYKIHEDSIPKRRGSINSSMFRRWMGNCYFFAKRFTEAIVKVIKEFRYRFHRHLMTLFVASTLFLSATGGAPPPAFARVTQQQTPIVKSVRPGMSREQADALITGELSNEDFEAFDSAMSIADEEVTKSPLPSTSANNEYDDFGDFNPDEEDIVPSRTEYKKMSTVTSAAASKSHFASYHDRSEAAQKSTRFKVGVLVFGPTFGGTFVREFFRRRREQAYVKKGLEIQKAQYAEYFNITNNTEDSDLEDAIKGIKKNETDTDNDDEYDDDDDDEDDDSDDDSDNSSSTLTSRKRPKRPSPDDSGGSGTDGGGGGPSDEDLERLNQMFKKS